ncbi:MULTISPECIES: hypothetical protein [unclassified Acidovorax]|uniref:hypothetical protein n=1 Tax=unclassified Acidovorax TaxID=2684926 RepID=UPI000B404D66|nr:MULTISPECIES: hypothetical protein [unclassified Acidovorax]
MAKSKALIAAEAQIAALNARLDTARTVYVNQKARIAELEAALNTRGAKPAATPTVSRYTDRAGRVWEKTRVGSHATSRLVEAAH